MLKWLILLVEDFAPHIAAIKEEIEGYGVEVDVARDGQEALDYLDRAEQLPDLIILDINMPRVDGFEFLERIKADPKIKRIPAIIMTTSEAGKDVLKGYDLNAAAYIVKPRDYPRLMDRIKKILGLYQSAKLPTRTEEDQWTTNSAS